MDNIGAVTKVATWAATECEKQRSGELSVGWMVAGWEYAYRHMVEPLTIAHILEVARLVEPRVNFGRGFREFNVIVGLSVPPDWHEVNRLMEDLVRLSSALEPDLWYKSYEEIHPLGDGNGRTGNIFWNWLSETLQPRDLDFPPDYWGARAINI